MSDDFNGGDNTLNGSGLSPVKAAAQTAVLMGILTLGSKLLGFVREMVMAAYFGTSYIVDAYVMAQSIPNMIFAGIFGAVAVAYMPVLAKVMREKGQPGGNKFTSQTINILLVAALIASAVGLVFSEPLVALLAHGFEGETAELTVFFVRITFSYLIFSSISGVLEAYLQYKGVFLPQILIGYLQNMILIAVIVISAIYSYYLLAFGYLIAYCIRMLVTALLARRKELRYTPSFRLGETGKLIWAMAIPVFIGNSAGQINLLVDRTLASGLPEGSVSALNYANLGIGLITGLTVTVLTTIIYPRLTRAGAAGEQQQFNAMLGTGVNLILIIAIPFSLGAMAFNDEAVQVIYERGAFDGAATELVASAFFYYAVGMVFSSLNTILSQTYYSKMNTKTPLLCGIFAVAANIGFNLLLIGAMQHNGLALATSISGFVNTVLLVAGLRRKYPEIVVFPSKKKPALILVLSMVSVGLAKGFYCFVGANLWMPRMVLLGLAVCVAGVCYLALLKLCKVEELALLKGILKR